MARKSTGSVIEAELSDGTRSFAIRFRVNGERQFQTLGYSTEGWTRERADEELANVMADVRRGQWAPPSTAAEPEPVPRIYEFAEQWFEAQRLEGGRDGSGMSAKWEEDLRWRLENHLLPFFVNELDNPTLDAITVQTVDRYRQAKRRESERRRVAIESGTPLRDKRGRVLRPLSSGSINKTLDTLAAILEQAVEYEHIASNPAKGKRRRLRREKPRRPYIDRAAHIVALLDAASALDSTARVGRGQRRALLATLVFAGLRINEALALRWRDVDLARGVIRIGHSKTAAGRRSVAMVPVLRDELLAYRAAQRDLDQHAYAFATSTGAAVSANNVRKRVLAKALGLANAELEDRGEATIDVALTPHALRRTYCSLLCATGEDIPYVMRQMGHASSAMTLDVYAQVMDRRDGERDRLKALVQGADWAAIDQSEPAEAVQSADRVAA